MRENNIFLGRPAGDIRRYQLGRRCGSTSLIVSVVLLYHVDFQGKQDVLSYARSVVSFQRKSSSEVAVVIV